MTPLPPPNWQFSRAVPGSFLNKKAIVCDIDGVLADATHRQHLVTTSNPQWREFFEGCGDDPLIPSTRLLLMAVESSHVKILLTARPLYVMTTTMEWLDQHDVPWDVLIMRDHGNYDSARNFKADEVDRIRAHGLDPQFALEDDPRNVEMFVSKGVPCLHVYSGYYERASGTS
ncbi:MAG: hypothetical protein ACP5PJ_02725 [Acidimicrobiales bacterium]